MPRVRYFAAAAEFAGRDEEARTETDLDGLRAALTRESPALGRILPRCAVLVDGRRTDGSAPLGADTLVDVLPPFAGGCALSRRSPSTPRPRRPSADASTPAARA